MHKEIGIVLAIVGGSLVARGIWEMLSSYSVNPLLLVVVGTVVVLAVRKRI